ncbi:MAG: hypothetical protein KAW12_04155 [Candidatus Aminicenantes bacterium]|nr:hypothetical protein [Candidatus Aminicenantes bacterium]
MKKSARLLTNSEEYINLRVNEEDKMLSVRATYDGRNLRLKEKVDIDSPKEVIVTFLEPIEADPSTEEIHQMVQEGGALDFLDDEREDIYSDSDLKVKY